MGQELECTLRYQRRALQGKAYLETDHILFRGEERIKIPLKAVKSVRAANGVLGLILADGTAEFDLGAAAAKWAQKILDPPSRLDKLGVKPGVAAEFIGDFDEDFRREMEPALTGAAHPDLLFFAVRRLEDLCRVPALSAALKHGGALWIIYPKGITAIREIDVIEAGRSAGLKDIKVAAFSATHTALKFAPPAATPAAKRARINK